MGGNALVPLPTVNSRWQGGSDSLFLVVTVYLCGSGGMARVGFLGSPHLSLRWLKLRLPGVGRVGGGIALVSAPTVNGCRLGGLDSMFHLATILLSGFRGSVLFGFLGPSSPNPGWRTLRFLGAGRIGGGAALVTVLVVNRCI